MAVNLKNVKDTVNLAAEVLGAAAAVIEGAKQLGVDVDAVGGAVKDAAGGAANGARVVADGIGKGFGAAAMASARQLAHWAVLRKRFRIQEKLPRLVRRSTLQGNRFLKERRR